MSAPVQENKKTFFSNLDGLRFFAFLAVFISHAALFLGFETGNASFLWLKKYVLTSGDLGVNFFFVLSGFLITYLLLSEKDRSGTIGIKNFYMRRVLRILPVYLLVVLLGFFVIPFIFPSVAASIAFPVHVPLSLLLWYLTLTANFKMASVGVGSLVLGVLWSIAVEEQFYLLWPFVISKISRAKYLFTFSVILLASWIFRYIHAYDYNQILYGTLSVFSNLIIGAMTAYFAMYSSCFQSGIKNLPKYLIRIIYCVGFLYVVFRGYVSHGLWGQWYKIYMASEAIIFSVFFAFIISEQNYALHSFYKAGKWPRASHLGRRSYGLYAYHLISFFAVSMIAHAFGLPFPYHSWLAYGVLIGTCFFLAIVFAEFSYTYIEKKILKYKEKFS